MLTYAAAFLAALLLTLAVTPVARRVALGLGVVDHPNDRKAHADPTPYLGGMAIIVAFAAAVVLGAWLRGLNLGGPALEVAAILGGGVVLAAMGLWDDLRVVPGWIKVPLEILAGLALFAAGVKASLFGVTAIDLIVTLAWVVGITNAVNYLDNMDGLSAGVSAIAASYFAALAALSGQVLVAGLAAALAGCALGFLWHNRPPAKIFMGDAGSLFVGFLLAALGLKLRFDNIQRVTFFVPVAVMAIPILDALLVSVSRVMRGLSPIEPGKDHISHRLVKTGIPRTAAVGLIWFAAATSGWLGVVIAYATPLIAYLIMGWLIVLTGFLGVLLLKVDP